MRGPQGLPGSGGGLQRIAALQASGVKGGMFLKALWDISPEGTADFI